MQMSQGANFRMHKRGTTNWKEGRESYYNSHSPQWCHRRESKILTKPTVFDVCHILVWWGKGHFSFTKWGNKPHVLVWVRTPRVWYFFYTAGFLQGLISQQHLNVDAEGPLANFVTQHARRGSWQLFASAAWELSLVQRALEQLSGDLGKKEGAGHPAWWTEDQGASCSCQGTWTVRPHHQLSC